MNDTPTTMKAYDSNQVWVCSECGEMMFVDWASIPLTATHRHLKRGTSKPLNCPNSGKRFKLPMVELEEVKPA